MSQPLSEDGTSNDGGAGRPRRAPRPAANRRLRSERQPVPTELPRIPDGLWAKLDPLIQRYDPPAKVGRRRTNQRRVLDAILYRLVTGCPWNELPPTFPHPSAVYRTYQRWLRYRLMDEILQVIITSAQHAQTVQRN